MHVGLLWGETMKHVDMRSNMEHFSKVRKGQQDHGQPSHIDNEIMGFFQEFLMILNKFQRSYKAEVCN